jgi:hypothetical protein
MTLDCETMSQEKKKNNKSCENVPFGDIGNRGILYTSTEPLPMRYTTMGYTSMIYTSTAPYFYKQSTQVPNKIFLKHFKQKICK